MIIDFHTHAFPDPLAPRAIGSLSEKSGNVIATTDGTVRGLLNRMDRSDTDMAVVLNIATNAGQMKKVNDFAIASKSDRMVPFGSVHPDAPGWEDELFRLKEAGIKGIKLHPDYQNFFVDDARMFKIYETAARLGLITVFHAGLDIGWNEPIHCTPARLKNALPAFSGGIVVAAHMGGYMCWKEALECLAGQDVYMDTSYSYSRMPPILAKELIDAHGVDRFLLGSDSPWSDTDLEIRFIKSLSLPQKDEQKIFFQNALRILKLN